MNKKDWEEIIREDYCNCGARHGLIDEIHKCSKNCFSTELITYISKFLKKEREKTLKEIESLGRRHKSEKYSTDVFVILGRKWDKLKKEII